jgi:hypothetical protein
MKKRIIKMDYDDLLTSLLESLGQGDCDDMETLAKIYKILNPNIEIVKVTDTHVTVRGEFITTE